MKKIILSTIAATLLFTACQNKNSTLNSNDELTTDTNMVAKSSIECYTYINNKDTATLNLTKNDGVLFGELDYKLFEKDSNKGTVEGEMKGDTLVLEYTFNSEGRESIRQVVMLQKANQLLEGTGDMEEINGKFVFKNRSTLIFGQGITFSKIHCN